MAELFANKYRITSTRLQYWDYGNPGMYFITVCTKNRKNYFGDISDLSEIGQIAHDEWYRTPELRPDMNLELGEFVVMPNHIHGIVIIGANEYNNRKDSTILYKNKFAPQSKNLASVMRGYKSAVTTYARKHRIEFNWQSLFHEHIIRTERAYRNISNYIVNNPAKWVRDRFRAKK